MRLLAALGSAALAGSVLIAATAGSPPVPPDDPSPGSGDTDPELVCATGCSAEPDARGNLTHARFEELLAEWSEVPVGEESLALDTLLFEGARASALLAEHGATALDAEHLEVLERELARDRAWLEVRMVNDEGVERMHLDPIAVPLGEKQHLFPEYTLDLTPPEVSGTIHRVGVRHLWTRL